MNKLNSGCKNEQKFNRNLRRKEKDVGQQVDEILAKKLVSRMAIALSGPLHLDTRDGCGYKAFQCNHNNNNNHNNHGNHNNVIKAILKEVQSLDLHPSSGKLLANVENFQQISILIIRAILFLFYCCCSFHCILFGCWLLSIICKQPNKNLAQKSFAAGFGCLRLYSWQDLVQNKFFPSFAGNPRLIWSGNNYSEY